MQHLTGMDLADALVAAGLAPEGISKLPATRFTEAWYYVTGNPSPWRPWASWDAVAPIMERYRMTLAPFCNGQWMVVPDSDAPMGCLSGTFTELPCLIGNLALALRAREVEQEQHKSSDAHVMV